MSSKQKSKNTQPSKMFLKTKGFFKRHKIISIILVILILWGLIWAGQVAVERYRFYQAEKKLDSLVYSLQHDLAQSISPGALEKARSCHYSSAKFSKGTLSCSIYMSQKYGAGSVEKANSLSKTFLEELQKDQSVDHKTLSSNDKKEFTIEDLTYESNFHEIRYSFRFNNLGLDCSLVLRPGVEAFEKLEVLFGCTNKSKFTYFPVKD